MSNLEPDCLAISPRGESGFLAGTVTKGASSPAGVRPTAEKRLRLRGRAGFFALVGPGRELPSWLSAAAPSAVAASGCARLRLLGCGRGGSAGGAAAAAAPACSGGGCGPAPPSCAHDATQGICLRLFFPQQKQGLCHICTNMAYWARCNGGVHQAEENELHGDAQTQGNTWPSGRQPCLFLYRHTVSSSLPSSRSVKGEQGDPSQQAGGSRQGPSLTSAAGAGSLSAGAGSAEGRMAASRSHASKACSHTSPSCCQPGSCSPLSTRLNRQAHPISP